MNEPERPQDPPTEGAPPAHNPTGTTPHGVPDGASDAEPKGMPDSGRHQTETVPDRV